MSHPLFKQIEELDKQTRELERFIYDNIGNPGWNEKGSFWEQKISEYHTVLFKLAQKRQESYNEGKIISYTPVAHLPRIINRSINVTR